MIKTYVNKEPNVDKEITDEDINTKNLLLKSINIGEVTKDFKIKTNLVTKNYLLITK